MTESTEQESELKQGRGHAALYMAPILAQSILPIVTLPIFTRILSREEYGLWGIATAFGAVVAGTAGLGLHTGYERGYFAAPDAARRARLLFTVASFALGAQLLGLLVVLLAGPALAARMLGSPDRSYLFVLAFGTAAVSSLKTFFLITLRNEGRAREYIRYSVDELFLGVLLSLVAVVWLRLGAAGLIVGPLTAVATVTLVLAANFTRRGDFGWDLAQLRETLKISLPLAPRIFIGSVGNQLDRLVLGAIGSLGAVGVYTIGQRMAQFVFAFMTALQNVYQPQVYRMLFASASASEIGRFLLPFAYASAGVAVTAILFAREIVAIVTPPEYAGAALIVGILSVYYGSMFFGKQPQLVFARRTGLVSVLSVLTVMMNGAAVYFGGTVGGAAGAAVGLLTAGIVTGAIGLWLATRHAPILYPMPAIIVIFAALPIALSLTVALDAAPIARAASIAAKVLLLGLFAWAGWRSGLIAAVWRGTAQATR